MKYLITFLVLAEALTGCGGDPAELALNGEACTTADACESGTCVTDLEGASGEALVFPDGMCMTDCTGDPAACERGYEDCIPVKLGDPEAYCAIRCATDDECRTPEYGCLQLSPWDPLRWCLPESLRRPWDTP